MLEPAPDSDFSRKIEEHERFTREIYERSYRPAYDQLGIVPKLLLRLPVVLPFHLPLAESATFTFAVGESEACTLAFESLIGRHVIEADRSSPKSVSAEVRRSRVLMTFASSSSADIAIDELRATKAFDAMLAKLNTIITAYMVVTKDFRVYHVSKEMFEFASLTITIDPVAWKTQNYGLFLLHTNAHFTKPEIEAATLDQVVWFVSVIEKGINPFVLSEELALSARRELIGGSFREAVIFAQSSVETFLSILISKTMELEGATAGAIEDMLQDVGFATRLKREYHTRFGGEWNTTRLDTAVGRWFSTAYQLRNRVVHAGYSPTYAEASEALSASQAMRSYVAGLVHRVRKKYPAIAAYFDPP